MDHHPALAMQRLSNQDHPMTSSIISTDLDHTLFISINIFENIFTSNRHINDLCISNWKK